MKKLLLALILLSGCSISVEKENKETEMKLMPPWELVAVYKEGFDKCAIYKKKSGDETIYWSICDANNGLQSSVFVK